jgi:hypothetical protein
MKRTGLRGWVALLIGPMVLVAAETPALMLDSHLVTPTSPLRWDKGTILVSLKALSTYLDAGFQWNEAEKTTWIQKYGRTIFFHLSTESIATARASGAVAVLGVDDLFLRLTE